MNSPIICLSLRYIITSHYNIIKVSKWISDELVSRDYSILKLIRCIDKEDFKNVNLIIRSNKDKIIFDENFINHEFNFHKYFILIQILVENKVDIKEHKELINAILVYCNKIICQETNTEYFRIASEEKFNLSKYFMLIMLLLDNEIDIKIENINRDLIDAIKENHNSISDVITELGLNKDCALKHTINFCLSKLLYYYERTAIFYHSMLNFYQYLVTYYI